MTNYPKRLIEVDLPIKRISAHARREKSIRHGHISTLHIWWARRPLAACRAVICASLWPDPADDRCPPGFRIVAADLMYQWARAGMDKHSVESHENFTVIRQHTSAFALANHPTTLRKALLDFIADFANWDNSTDPEFLRVSRTLTSVSHYALGREWPEDAYSLSWMDDDFSGEVQRIIDSAAESPRPLVVDPFAGGGSIPLEALRVGADAFASDLNPIPVLLNKVVLEYIPKYGQRLADEVRKWGEWIKEEAEKDLGKYYPVESDNGRPMAFLWARTILSESPGEEKSPVEVPLFRSMWLCSKPKRRTAIRWKRNTEGKVVTETAKICDVDGVERTVRRPILEIFHPKSSADVENGTSQGGAATCPVTGYTNSVEQVRKQLKSRCGGAADARLLCVVSTPHNSSGRVYRLPEPKDLKAVFLAKEDLKKRVESHKGDLPLLPEGRLNHLRGFFNVVLYGMDTWADLFAPRQALSLCYLLDLIKTIRSKYGDDLIGEAVQTCLAMALDRCADKCASVVVWHIPGEKVEHVFGRQALPMVWDFAEANILADIGWSGACEWVQKVVQNNSLCSLPTGISVSASATTHPLPNDTVDAFVTDPPYYAAIPYADLSDFFYSWLRRSVGDIHPELFRQPLTPKDEECVQLSHRAAMYREKDAAWFEAMMTRACAEGRRVTKPHGIGIVVFANKETSGWEAMLAALITSGWVITASWPIDTEMGTRLRARNSAALASSVHLVCRPRENLDGTVYADEIGDWRDVLEELPRRIHEWMPRLAAEGVVGADAIFACLGPALEIFSRYSRVEKASGEVVTLKEYLEQVWAAVSREALSSIIANADLTAFESDARLTAMWLWTLSGGTTSPEDSETPEEDDEESSKSQSTSGFGLEYDAARKIAQGLGAHLEDLKSLVEIKGDQARLLPVSERTAYLFGKEQASVPETIARKKKKQQLDLFAELTQPGVGEEAWEEKTVTKPGETVLDRIHQSMILFATGRSGALKRFLVEDGIGQDAGFWKLAQALSALYPTGTQEKRWVDGVLARKKGLGL